MQKTIYSLSILYLLSSCSPKSFSDVKQEIVDLNKQAQTCVKSFSLDNSKICSFSYDLEKTVFNNKNDCEKSFDRKGIATIYVDQKNKNEFSEFYYSTNRALLDHLNRKVLFKKNVYNLVDCYHEYIHLLQSHYGNELGLSQRKRKGEYFKELLSKSADQVANLEQNKKIKEAKKLANDVQKGIDELTKFNLLTEYLDEIEAYHLVLRKCDFLKCSAEDKEIAIANLLKRKEYISLEYQKLLQNLANSIILEKKKKLYKDVASSWKESKLSQEIKSLKGLSVKKIIQFISNKGISLYRIASKSDFNFKAISKQMIDIDLYKKLPIIKDRLRDYMGLKILLGKAMGKFVCTGKENFIIVNRLVTKSTLIHEYLHYVQSKLNPNYCNGDSRQKELYEKFKIGEISKKVYENDVLMLQLKNQIAEYEVYSELVKYENDFSDIENLNNKAKLQELQSDLQYLK